MLTGAIEVTKLDVPEINVTIYYESDDQKTDQLSYEIRRDDSGN